MTRSSIQLNEDFQGNCEKSFSLILRRVQSWICWMPWGKFYDEYEKNSLSIANYYQGVDYLEKLWKSASIRDPILSLENQGYQGISTTIREWFLNISLLRIWHVSELKEDPNVQTIDVVQYQLGSNEI